MANAANTVLLVDDEPSLVKAMSLYLTRLGYLVVGVGDSDAAWEIIQADPGAIAIAFLDGSLPGLGSRELGRRLLAANPQAEVVVASGYPTDLSELRAAGPGRVTFLPKPFTAETLAGHVRRVLP